MESEKALQLIFSGSLILKILEFYSHLVYTLKCILEVAMEVTTKELRIQPGKIIDQVANGQEITVTFRGKALARIVPILQHSKYQDSDETSIFGMWKTHSNDKTVEDTVREIRKGRQF